LMEERRTTTLLVGTIYDGARESNTSFCAF
jgi:hypothetical protein